MSTRADRVSTHGDRARVGSRLAAGAAPHHPVTGPRSSRRATAIHDLGRQSSRGPSCGRPTRYRRGNGLGPLWRRAIRAPAVVVSARASDGVRHGCGRGLRIGRQRRYGVDRQHRAGRFPGVHIDDSGADLAEHPLAFGRRWQLPIRASNFSNAVVDVRCSRHPSRNRITGRKRLRRRLSVAIVLVSADEGRGVSARANRPPATPRRSSERVVLRARSRSDCVRFGAGVSRVGRAERASTMGCGPAALRGSRRAKAGLRPVQRRRTATSR